MSKGLLANHWIAPLATVPFGVMLIFHRVLNLSDALLAVPKPGQQYWPFYNVVLVLVFYLGLGVYLAHTFWMYDRGWVWVIAKCVALAIALTGVVVIFQYSA